MSVNAVKSHLGCGLCDCRCRGFYGASRLHMVLLHFTFQHDAVGNAPILPMLSFNDCALPAGRPATIFTDPWTKSPADGYVYFGVAEFDPSSNQIKSRVARVCHDESEPPDTNNFASFLKMEVTCNGGVYNLDADQITAVAAGVGGTTPVYLAFATSSTLAAAGTTNAPGAVVCAFEYDSQPYGIDYEMNGMVCSLLSVFLVLVLVLGFPFLFPPPSSLLLLPVFFFLFFVFF